MLFLLISDLDRLLLKRMSIDDFDIALLTATEEEINAAKAYKIHVIDSDISIPSASKTRTGQCSTQGAGCTQSFGASKDINASQGTVADQGTAGTGGSVAAAEDSERTKKKSRNITICSFMLSDVQDKIPMTHYPCDFDC